MNIPVTTIYHPTPVDFYQDKDLPKMRKQYAKHLFILLESMWVLPILKYGKVSSFATGDVGLRSLGEYALYDMLVMPTSVRMRPHHDSHHQQYFLEIVIRNDIIDQVAFERL